MIVDAGAAGIFLQWFQADGGAAFVDIGFVFDGRKSVLICFLIEVELGAVKLFFALVEGYPVFEISKVAGFGIAFFYRVTHHGEVFFLGTEVRMLDDDEEDEIALFADAVAADPAIGVEDMRYDPEIDRVLHAHKVFEAIYLRGVDAIFFYR